MGNVQLQQQLFKGVPVFRLFNGGAVGADDVHAQVGQGLSQIHGGLTAQGGNHAVRLLQCHDVHHILGGQGLKIELIRSGVVRGDGFRVVVDDDGLVACFPDGLHRMDGGVVEFHTLANTDGAGAQDDDLLPGSHNGFVFRLVGGVEIGNIAVKLRGAGVDHPVARENVLLLANFVDFPGRNAPELGNGRIGKAHFLRREESGGIGNVVFQEGFHLNDVPQLS